MAAKTAETAETPTSAEIEPLHVETRPNPQRAAIQRAAQREHARKMQPGTWVGLPNGETVRVQGYIGMKYPGEKAADMLGKPHEMLSHPKPAFSAGPRYQWRVRTSAGTYDARPAETASLHRSGKIRYVETKEIDPSCSFAVYDEYATTNNTYVVYKTLILCEILDERHAYQSYRGWEDWALHRVADLEGSTRGERDTHVEGKTEIAVKGPQDSRAGG